jgi:hypothetical protein
LALVPCFFMPWAPYETLGASCYLSAMSPSVGVSVAVRYQPKAMETSSSGECNSSPWSRRHIPQTTHKTNFYWDHRSLETVLIIHVKFAKYCSNKECDAMSWPTPCVCTCISNQHRLGCSLAQLATFMQISSESKGASQVKVDFLNHS